MFRPVGDMTEQPEPQQTDAILLVYPVILDETAGERRVKGRSQFTTELQRERGM